jgi:D-alanyl-D-alanine carboxypeptidase (penicillin-binding protein 5/6)
VILCLARAELLPKVRLGKLERSFLAYEQEHFSGEVYLSPLFAEELCIVEDTVGFSGTSIKQLEQQSEIEVAALFSVSDQTVLYATDTMYDQCYPASLTKLMTAYLVLQYGNLDDVVEVSENATDFAEDEQVCGLLEGDQITLYDLLCGLMLHSGNDTAIAIAEHMSGDVATFVQWMNEEAVKLGATNTNFLNPHGLHQKSHYSTPYDLYLMFNACLQDERFIEIISMNYYTASITQANGTVRDDTWWATNWFSQGIMSDPDNVEILGGKTGTTDQAGACVILYSLDTKGKPYISLMMGATTKDILYESMSELYEEGI